MEEADIRGEWKIDNLEFLLNARLFDSRRCSKLNIPPKRLEISDFIFHLSTFFSSLLDNICPVLIQEYPTSFLSNID